MAECWLAQFADTPCDGNLVRAHLIPRRELRDLWKRVHHSKAVILPAVQEAVRLYGTLDALVKDPRSWVPACGGVIGNGGHHGDLDFTRRIRVPFDKLPPGTVEMAGELGLLFWLEREYGGAKWIA